MSDPDWLDGLQRGDFVVVHDNSGFIQRKPKVCQVTRATPTQIVAGGLKWRRRTGTRVGRSADISKQGFIEPYEPLAA